MMPVFNLIELWYKIPKSISATFFSIETGYGSSKVFLSSFNLGGIRNKSGYKKYRNVLEAAFDFGKVLSNKRYKINNLSFVNSLYAYEKGGYWEKLPDQISKRINVYNKIKCVL